MMIPSYLTVCECESIPLRGMFFVLSARFRKQSFQRSCTKQKGLSFRSNLSHSLAEKEGFEPPVVLPTTVFKTAAIDRSAISPGQKYIKIFFLILNRKKIFSEFFSRLSWTIRNVE